MLYRLTPQESTVTEVHSLFGQSIPGRFLERNDLPAHRRGFIAADIVLGRTPLAAPTIAQAAMLARCSQSYTRYALDVLRTAPHLRAAVEGRTLSLLDAARPNRTSAALARAWASADGDERIAFINSVGTEPVWTALSRAIA